MPDRLVFLFSDKRPLWQILVCSDFLTSYASFVLDQTFSYRGLHVRFALVYEILLSLSELLNEDIKVIEKLSMKLEFLNICLITLKYWWETHGW